MRVTVWNEYRHEVTKEHVAKIYPDGIHGLIASFLRKRGFEVKTATLLEPEHGLTDEVLDNTDVLIWWGHCRHKDVRDDIVDKVYERVMRGMGLIVLHSGHYSKIFKRLMGTSCSLKWHISEKERIWTVAPNHPIAKGVDETFVLPEEEMYGERFDIPEPEEVVFMSWFSGGYVFRSGCTFKRGLGKIFYFRPGHEEFASFHNENVQKIIGNACEWACPNKIGGPLSAPCVAPLE
ncbi:MAG: trehalose utilization protein ThuA [Ruminococcaceae bacterium]|nr:trehalose utilization protein ThuA [Oscillospiraceae bacterium]